MTTSALITHRDRIVGVRQGFRTPKARSIEDLSALTRWEPWVRAAALDAELQAGLYYGQVSLSYAAAGSPTAGFEVRVVQQVAGKWADTSLAAFAPPSTSQLVAQTGLVLDYADLRDDLAAEVLAQMSAPYAFWASVAGLQPDRHRYTYELISLVLRFANVVEMRIKHALQCPRPIEFSNQVQPIIQTPGHGSLPSGHATEAFAVATLLARLCAPTATPGLTAMLHRQAARIATNRVVAGVHFPVDSAAGRLLGVTLAEYLLARCNQSELGASTSYAPRRFIGPFCVETDDVDLSATFDTPTSASPIQQLSQETAVTSPLLMKLWGLAAQEWS